MKWILLLTLLDPTTPTPAIITHQASMADWNSSQPFFSHGWYEVNPRFTLSNLPNDHPLNYEAGRKIILRDSIQHLAVSSTNNIISRVVEGKLIHKYPDHKRLVKTLGWAERIGLASYVSYNGSIKHIRQAKLNNSLSNQLGYR